MQDLETDRRRGQRHRKRLTWVVPLVVCAADLTICWSCMVGAYYIRFNPSMPEMPQQPLTWYVNLGLLLSAVLWVSVYSSGAYELRALSSWLDSAPGMARGITMAALLGILLNYLLRGYVLVSDVDAYSRLLLAIWWSSALAALLVWRLLVSAALRRLHRGGILVDPAVLVGPNRALDEIRARDVELRERAGIEEIASVVTDGHAGRDEGVLAHEVGRLAVAVRATRVIVTDDELSDRELSHIQRVCDRAGIRLGCVADSARVLGVAARITEVAGLPIIEYPRGALLRWGHVAKRILDSVASLLLVIALSPLWLLTVAAIVIESGWPVLYRQQRIGRHGRTFGMLKFRSMHVGADRMRQKLEALNEVSGPIFKIREDPRVTRVGKVLRRWSMDELPQLLNVLKGDMSLVGPRPFPTYEVEKFTESQRRRFEVLPGVTGLAQVSGRSDLDFGETLRLDLVYVESWTPWLDLQILLRTVPAVVRSRGAY